LKEAYGWKWHALHEFVASSALYSKRSCNHSLILAMSVEDMKQNNVGLFLVAMQNAIGMETSLLPLMVTLSRMATSF
jgi:hypothetical protein